MMVIYLPVNSIGQTVFELESGNKNVDGRQMDVGHINLIGGLVTHNPPKNDPNQDSSGSQSLVTCDLIVGSIQMLPPHPPDLFYSPALR